MARSSGGDWDGSSMGVLGRLLLRRGCGSDGFMISPRSLLEMARDRRCE